MSGSPSNDRLQSLQSSISQYLAQTDFDVGDQGEIDRIERRLSSNPEKYITPNPGVPYQEDLSGNWERIKNKFGLTPKRELEQQLQDYDQRVQDFLLDSVREVIDDVGVFAVANYVYGGVPTGNRSAEQTIDDILDEASPDVFRAEIDNRLGNIEQEVPGGLGFERQDSAADDVLDQLNAITDREFSDIDRAIDNIESQLQNAEADARRRILTRFENAFGQRFEDVDEAVNQLRDQFTQLQNLDIETVEASFFGGDETPGVTLPVGFGELENDVQQRAAEVIDLEATADALPSRRRERPFADVRVREGEIERIDFGKAVNDPNIILREDADLAEAADPALSESDEQQDDVEIAVPEPEPTPDEDDDGTPEVELVDESGEIDDELTELAQTAIAAADDEDDAANAVIQLARVLNPEQATELAAGIDRNQIPQPLIDQLRDIFNRAGRDARSEARRETFGVNEIQRVLGLEEMEPDTGDDPEDIFDVPDDGFQPDEDDDTGGRRRDNGETQRGPGGNPRRERGSGRSANPADDIADDVRDVVRDEIRDFAADASSGQGGDPNNLRSQPNSDRPDPDQRKADKRLQPLLGNSLAKAQKWIAAEGDRLALNPSDPPSPRQYWEQKGSNFYGNMLSRREFINLTVDGVSK